MTRWRSLETIVIATAAVTLTGCETLYAGKYRWSEGWREATVVQVRNGADVPYARWSKCTKGMTPEQLRTHDFAQVRYMQGRYRREWLPMPDGLALQPGESIYANLARCEGEIVRR